MLNWLKETFRPEKKPVLYITHRPTWPKEDFKRMAVNAVSDLGRDLIQEIPKDIEEYCPAYAGFGPAKRIEFYAELLGALANFESRHNPEVTYKEKFKDAKGKNVISRGLLQLSFESCNGYGAGLKSEEQLHDPQVNISCAVLIMRKWIREDRVISGKTWLGKWRGMARYWSPFRDKEKTAAMKAALRSFR